MKKKLKTGQAGGIACRIKHGSEFYSRIAKEAHKRRRVLLKKVDKGV